MQRRVAPTPVNADRWYASYSVLMTLMFALFVVLFSTAQVDRDRFRALAESLQQAFGVPATPKGKLAGDAQKAEIQKAISTRQEFGQMRDQVEELFAVAGQPRTASDLVRLDSEGVTLSVALRAPQLFRAGQAELAPDVLPLLDRVGRVLVTSPRALRIEGHADEVEVARVKGGDATRLALARARAVSDYLTGRLGIARERVRLGVQAHTEAAAGNQHVEIVVLGR